MYEVYEGNMSATNRAADKQLLRFPLRLSFRNTILNLYLRVQTTGSGAAVDNLNFRSEDLLTDLG